MTDARKSIQSFVLFAHMSRDITIILVVMHKKYGYSLSETSIAFLLAIKYNVCIMLYATRYIH